MVFRYKNINLFVLRAADKRSGYSEIFVRDRTADAYLDTQGIPYSSGTAIFEHLNRCDLKLNDKSLQAVLMHACTPTLQLSSGVVIRT